MNIQKNVYLFLFLVVVDGAGSTYMEGGRHWGTIASKHIASYEK
jgi:hypothetical protein